MDPPYQGVCGERDSRYFAGVLFDDFVAQLAALNLKNVRYLVSYDGRLGNRSYGKPLPAKLNLTLVEIEAGRSSQATLLGRDEMTVESLYLSPPLAEELEVVPTMHRRHHDEQMQANHVAMRQIRRIDLVWQGEEVAQYDKLKSDAEKSGVAIPDFVKEVLAKALK
jgi:DNA adenine methylase